MMMALPNMNVHERRMSPIMKSKTPSLSICIPTYNRAVFLAQALESLERSAKGNEGEIEIVISDNASTDDTASVVKEFAKDKPWIKYYRNSTNIGSEQNRYKAVVMASGDYVWIFGDDDKVTGQAVAVVLNYIHAGHNLIVCNFAVWSRDFRRLKKRQALITHRNETFGDPNKLMIRFGLHVGYTPSFIIKREDFLGVRQIDYGPHMNYCFPHVYSVYAAMAKHCDAVYVSDPLVLNRADNSFVPDYYKSFVVGSCLVFESLRQHGFTEHAIWSAKHLVLRAFVVGDVVLRKSRGDSNLRDICALLAPHYRKDWLFWAICVPLSYVPLPPFLARIAVRTAIRLRRSQN